MKIVKVLFFSILATVSFGQTYEAMPTSVKHKMDENKVAGLPILNGITTKLVVTVENLLTEEIAALSQVFDNDLRIVSFEVAADRSFLVVTANADFSIKDVKNHIVSSNALIVNYTQEFILLGN